MKSTKLSSNKLFAVLKNQFKRNLIWLIVLQIASAIIALAYAQGATFFYLQSVGMLESSYENTDITGVLCAMSVTVTSAALVCAFGAVLKAFKQTYSKRASDFYFALPVKRETNFVASLLFNVINTVMAHIVSFAAALGYIEAFGNITVNSVKYVLYYDFSKVLSIALVLLAVTVCAITLFMLFAVLSGKVWHYVLFCYIYFNWVGFLGVAAAYCLNSIWGFWRDITLAGVFNPIGAVALLARADGKYMLPVLIVSLVQAAVCFAIGYLVFKKRKAEIAEFTVSGKALPLAIVAFMQAAMFMLICMSGNNEIFDGFNVIAISAIAAIIVSLIATVIMAVKFLNKSYSKLAYITFAAVVAVCGVYILAINNLPFNSYVTYVPEASEVESIEFTDGGSYGNDGVVGEYVSLVAQSGDMSYLNYQGSYEIKEEKTIDAVIKLHQKVASNEFKKTAMNDNEFSGEWNFKITYKLENGKTVTRCYCVPFKSVKDERTEIMKTREVLAQNKPFTYENEDILFVTFETADEEQSDYEYEYEDYETYEPDYYELAKNFIYDLDDYDGLKSAYLDDLVSESPEMFAQRASEQSLGFGYQYLDEYDYMLSEPLDDKLLEKYYASISFFVVSEQVPEAEREKIKQMTPKQVYEYREKSGNGWMYIEEDYYTVYRDDAKTIEYFENLK